MTTESTIPDNQKIKDNNSTIGNYIIAIITAVIFTLARYKITLAEIFSTSHGIGMLLATLIFPAIFAGIYYLFKRKGFSKAYAWLMVIVCVLSYIGSQSE